MSSQGPVSAFAEGGRGGRDADLAPAKIPCQVNRCRQLGAGEYATRVEERLVRHQEPAGARLGVLDRGRQMGIDALAIAHELSEPLPDRLVHLHACLGDARVRGSNEQIGISQVPLYERELAVAVKGRSDETRRTRMPVEEDVLPGDLDVVEHDQRVDFVEAVGERIVLDRPQTGEARTADVLDPGSVHLGDEADRVVGELLMTPVADGRLHEGLVRVGGRGLELGAADDDAVIRLANDVEEHVRVLLLRALRPVPLGSVLAET